MIDDDDIEVLSAADDVMHNPQVSDGLLKYVGYRLNISCIMFCLSLESCCFVLFDDDDLNIDCSNEVAMPVDRCRFASH